MIAYGDRVRRKTIEPEVTARYWIDRIEHLLRCCVRDHARIPAQQRLDVMFHEVTTDVNKVIGDIYGMAGMPLTDKAQAQFAAYLRANPRGKYGQVLYHLQRDFGVDPAQLRERFQFYFDKFPIRAEG